MNIHETYMHRCLQLAVLGAANVSPNPMVGAVLVHNDRIIGEGYHKKYGEAHAEVNCIASVKDGDRHLISASTLYVSLEPCAHFGKTPPCADLIIENKISKVVIGCRDPFTEVDGKGIEKLKAEGVEVIQDVLSQECVDINKRFFIFHTVHRPYVILKWAETADRKIARRTGERLLISNQQTNRLVHQWRSESMAIVVGTNTAELDDPELTTRLWPGSNPIRVVVDMNLRLPQHLKLFTSGHPTIVFNLHRHTLPFEKLSTDYLRKLNVAYYQVTEDVSLVHQMMNAFYRLNIQSVLVEGGAYLLQSFIEEGLWDEARLICNEELFIGDGLPSPVLKNHELISSEKILSDVVCTYKNTNYH